MLLKQFQAACARAPNRLAVAAGGRQLSYGDLALRSAAIARFLLRAGLGAGDIVALYLPRGVEVLAGLLGVMRAGAAYTVVEDDGQSAEHQHRLQQIAPRFVLCEAAQVAALQALGLRAASIGDALRDASDGALPEVAPSDVAYVLFTSGSTGKPKGVAVTHANIAHYTGAIAEQLGLGAEGAEPLRYAHASTLAADLGNTSLFLSLWSGGCLHLIDSRTRRDPAALRDLLIEHRIQFLKITPSHWNAIFSSMGEPHLQSLRLKVLVLGGEVLPVSLARRILASGAVRVLLNHYGPTETTVGVTTFALFDSGRLDTLRADSVPIGAPLGRTELRVRTEAGQFCEKAARGELYIGGPSVALGYVGDPETTARAFVELDEPNAKGRFYKTGDQVEIDDNGVVQFLGRVDRQVKVNGYRVELEHVESLLRTGPGVAEAAAFFLEVRGKPRIVAAIAGAQDPQFEALKQHLSRVMPPHMVPKVFLPFPAFPRNENGKTDLKALKPQVEALLAAQAEARTEAGDDGGDALVAELRRAWAQYLHDESFGNDDSFFDLGGDSLDAIQLIAALQLQGHDITTHAFLGAPTVRGLAEAIRRRESAASAAAAPQANESPALSAAQDFFFRQRLADPDHYNQALLLECSAKVDAELLRKVLVQLAQAHPALRTAYRREGDAVHAGHVEVVPEKLLELSFTVAHADAARVEAHIERTAQQVQRSLSLERGELFKAHLFKFEAAPDQLLLVAHHVAVDVISWRILVSELARLYGQQAAGAEMELPAQRHGFWHWVQHLDAHRDTLYRNAGQWLVETVERVRQLPTPVDEHNTEGSAQTLWMGFSAHETQLLLREAAARLKAPFHEILLAGFARALARQRGLASVRIDVESHGRVSFDDNLDLSRTVGWHTSTYPLTLQPGPDLPAAVAAASRALHAVPDLGAAYGVHEKHQPAGTPVRTSAPACFNYLGEFSFPHDERFTLRPSRHAIGRTRGDRNHRGHELKLTARVVDGHLVADLSFPGSVDARQMTAMMRGLKQELLALVGSADASGAILVEPGTRTGQLCYVPQGLALEPAAGPGRREYRTVLLTGATGYLGAHALRELLQQSQAQVVCLVRRRGGVAAAQRLQAAFGDYFPDMALPEGRCTVLEGDVSQPHFGLAAATYEHLADTVDAVYHFAADTRLFGPEEEFRRHNVAPVHACIAFASHRRPKDLHYMSTLAVCGVNPKPRALEFSEDSLHIGQEFQNAYEATKFQAESLLKAFVAGGGQGFVYRSGNVSGHSRSGRFQRNARDNRLVQFLAACARLGRLPRSLGAPVVLSPIDEVAAGIVAISLDAASPPGVYHVDSMQEIPMERVFRALRQIGLRFEDTPHPDFRSLFGTLRDSRDPVLALGYFWATRKPRNVRFNHERTHQALRRLGRPFSTLDDAWLVRLCGALAEAGAFGPPAATEPSNPVTAEAAP